MKKLAVAALLVMSLSIGTVSMAASNTSANETTKADTTTTNATAQTEASSSKSTEAKAADNSSNKSRKGMRSDINSLAAKILGKTEDEIKKSEKVGTTLYKQLTDAGKLDEFKKELLADMKTKLDAAVKAGNLTQAKADKIYSNAQTKINSWDGSTPFMGGKGLGRGEKSGIRIDVMSVAASVLSKTEDEIKAAAKDGGIGKLLVSAGKLDAFKAAYLQEAKKNLDAAVKAGTITQARADKRYSKEKTRMDSYDGTTPLRGGRHKGKIFDKSKETPSRDSGKATTSLTAQPKTSK